MAKSLKAIRNPLRNPVVAATVLGVLVLATAAVKARVWRHETPAVTNPQLTESPNGPAQIVRFTIYDAGIFPGEARVSAGAVALHLEDMSSGSAGLVVANESLLTVAQVLRRPQRSRDNARILLVPGRYTVYDANRPRNRATLIVEP